MVKSQLTAQAPTFLNKQQSSCQLSHKIGETMNGIGLVKTGLTGQQMASKRKWNEQFWRGLSLGKTKAKELKKEPMQQIPRGIQHMPHTKIN